jgi:hypothetical protein
MVELGWGGWMDGWAKNNILRCAGRGIGRRTEDGGHDEKEYYKRKELIGR